MLTLEDDVEIHALQRRGWNVSAIARRTGRDRKTVRKHLAGEGPTSERAPSCLEPFGGYLTARFEDDAHVLGSTLFGELVELGFERSYPTFVRELRRLQLRNAGRWAVKDSRIATPYSRRLCTFRGRVEGSERVAPPPGYASSAAVNVGGSSRVAAAICSAFRGA